MTVLQGSSTLASSSFFLPFLFFKLVTHLTRGHRSIEWKDVFEGETSLCPNVVAQRGRVWEDGVE